MRIVEKNNSIEEVVSLILQKARYQKVVVCIDEKSDMGYIGNLESCLGKNVILLKYYYNQTNVSSFFDIINNGVRAVVYNVSSRHFYKLQNDNGYLVNIFIPQTDFLLPYINNVESVYGENLIVYDTQRVDYSSVMFVYEMALNRVWADLLQDNVVDTSVFKNVDKLLNNKVEVCYELGNTIKALKPFWDDGYKSIDEKELPYYLYFRLCAILKMLHGIHYNEEQYIDFYKTEQSSTEIDKAYSLVVKHDIIDIIKNNTAPLIRLLSAILNRFKIIIKKYFKFKNIKLNKLIKLIKCQAKSLNIDNLLYISYVFNSI